MDCLSAVIDEEWQRTQCSPRETCVEVASELGSSTDTFFKPPCVNVFRCGGCCNEESLVCVNTSTSYVSKQVGGHEPSVALMLGALTATAQLVAKRCLSALGASSYLTRKQAQRAAYRLIDEDTESQRGAPDVPEVVISRTVSLML